MSGLWNLAAGSSKADFIEVAGVESGFFLDEDVGELLEPYFILVRAVDKIRKLMPRSTTYHTKQRPLLTRQVVYQK